MTEVPVTGHADVDQALTELADLEDAPVADHHERLVRAHAALHEALQTPAPGPPEASAGR